MAKHFQTWYIKCQRFSYEDLFFNIKNTLIETNICVYVTKERGVQFVLSKSLSICFRIFSEGFLVHNTINMF